MRKYNIKDSIMMPPPKARPKSHSDTSEELRKNLMDYGGSSSCDNSFFQEELHKYFKENEDQDYKRIDDEISICKSNESFLNEKSTNYHNSNFNNQINSPSILSNNQFNSENKSHINSFNFNMVNYLYNDICENMEENNHEYKKYLENLKLDLTKDSYSYGKFINLPTPSNNKEIRIFVHNLEKYISHHLFDKIFKNLQIKLQTRYNDYKNKGLNFDYFKETLEKMQKELISRICKQNNGEKKIETGLILL
jgi:hypothetical protein